MVIGIRRVADDVVAVEAIKNNPISRPGKIDDERVDTGTTVTAPPTPLSTSRSSPSPPSRRSNPLELVRTSLPPRPQIPSFSSVPRRVSFALVPTIVAIAFTPCRCCRPLASFYISCVNCAARQPQDARYKPASTTAETQPKTMSSADKSASETPSIRIPLVSPSKLT
jgi:hypothetical protein